MERDDRLYFQRFENVLGFLGGSGFGYESGLKASRFQLCFNGRTNLF